ncbi:MAG: hypothetical protein IAB75_04935 [Bacteroidetes bacterium]|jgi:hypothetical protein|uniref:Uncharacterized protein n=1 Tax=Candidatus Cryptobacteroides avicola TaxID=2840757 RepID=A0A940DRH7_9BACT|nr:hypothetical protein [Candidatus Cryptobacteroides avicola]
MRYFIRAVKYFIYFILLFVVIMAVLVLTGAAEGDISTMFRGGYSALWKIAVIFAVISAIYPSVGFIRKEAMIPGSWEEDKDIIKEFMGGRGYVLETEDTGTMSFRKTGMSRFTRMYEDRVTLSAKIGGVEIEGMRKDVLRLAMGLESRFRREE